MRERRVPRRARKLRAVLLAFAAAASWFALAAAPAVLAQGDESARLRAALEQARKDLESERAALAEDRSRFAASEEALRGRITALLADGERLAEAAREGERTLEALGEASARLRAARDAARAEEADLRRFVYEKIRALSSRIEIGIPHARRAARLSNLRTLELTASEPDAELAGILRGYLAQAIEEVALGASAEIYTTGVLTSEGTVQEADCLRIGKVYGGYRTRDGRHSAVLVPGIADGSGWEWREAGEAAEVVEAALSGTKGLVRVPMDVSLDIAADRISVSKDMLGTLLAGGLVMIPLGLLALAALALVIERTVVLLRTRIHETRIEREVLDAVRSGDPDGALARCAAIPGPAASALGAALRARATGRADAEKAFEEAAVRALPRFERFLPSLAALAAVAPLLGLLGTVTGMITTFDIITLFGSGDPRLLSGGISEALITTQIGLILAIPLLLIHRAFSGVVEQRIAAVETLGVSLVNALFHGAVPCAQPPGPGGDDGV